MCSSILVYLSLVILLLQRWAMLSHNADFPHVMQILLGSHSFIAVPQTPED